MRRLRRMFALVQAGLTEIFDESAYARFLERERLASSPAAYRRFLEEQGKRGPRPRCC